MASYEKIPDDYEIEKIDLNKPFDDSKYVHLSDYSNALRRYKFEEGYKPKHPVLFEYMYLTDEQQEEFRKKYIHPDMYWAEKNKEWDWIIEEPIWEVYQFPLFTKELSNMFIEESEHFGHWLGQHSGPNEGANYATTDAALASFPSDKNFRDTPLVQLHFSLQKKYVRPIIKKVWKYTPGSWDYPFIVKYTPEGQQFVEPHHDKAVCATIITLNEGYEGGGTYFERQKTLLDRETGWCTLHPSRLTHSHGSKRVTKGVRYILVTFIGSN